MARRDDRGESLAYSEGTMLEWVIALFMCFLMGGLVGFAALWQVVVKPLNTQVSILERMTENMHARLSRLDTPDNRRTTIPTGDEVDSSDTPTLVSPAPTG
jgi:hypothetical protein